MNIFNRRRKQEAKELALVVASRPIMCDVPESGPFTLRVYTEHLGVVLVTGGDNPSVEGLSFEATSSQAKQLFRDLINTFEIYYSRPEVIPEVVYTVTSTKGVTPTMKPMKLTEEERLAKAHRKLLYTRLAGILLACVALAVSFGPINSCIDKRSQEYYRAKARKRAEIKEAKDRCDSGIKSACVDYDRLRYPRPVQ